MRREREVPESAESLETYDLSGQFNPGQAVEQTTYTSPKKDLEPGATARPLISKRGFYILMFSAITFGPLGLAVGNTNWHGHNADRAEAEWQEDSRIELDTTPPTTIVVRPQGSFSPEKDHITCAHTSSHTLAAGENFEDIVTQGIPEESTFEAQVLEWNTNHVHSQLNKDPNAISAGTEFQSLDDCVEVSAVREETDYDSYNSSRPNQFKTKFTRSVIFQRLPGTTINQLGREVTVYYDADPITGEIGEPRACDPYPGCYPAVGIPKP